MRSSWLYFATRSDRDGAPVLICPQFVATARSAMVTSSVSPERCDITAAYPDTCASRTASSVSDSVPIWLTLTRIALPAPRSMPCASRSTLVTNRSSPTSCTRPPSAALSAHGGHHPAPVQQRLQRVERLGADAQRLGERVCADRHHHELLQVDIV